MTDSVDDDADFSPFDAQDFWLFERMVPGPASHLSGAELASLSRLAASTLHIESLETRSRDSLDFHEVSVWSVKEALARAFLAGTGRLPHDL